MTRWRRDDFPDVSSLARVGQPLFKQSLVPDVVGDQVTAVEVQSYKGTGIYVRLVIGMPLV